MLGELLTSLHDDGRISGLGSLLDLLLNELTRPLFDLLVFAYLYWMLMNPQMQAGTSHVSRSIHIH
jgi:hypothetical protein